MHFDTFANNVLRWSEERGILAHGNFKGQTLKAISEFGELADALAKGDKVALADAVGDVAVCLVNAHWLRTGRRLKQGVPVADGEASIAGAYSNYASQSPEEHTTIAHIAGAEKNPMPRALTGFRFMLSDWSKCGESSVLSAVAQIAAENELNFLDCCKGAWNEIKHRRGYLTADGLFIKEGDKA